MMLVVGLAVAFGPTLAWNLFVDPTADCEGWSLNITHSSDMTITVVQPAESGQWQSGQTQIDWVVEATSSHGDRRKTGTITRPTEGCEEEPVNTASASVEYICAGQSSQAVITITTSSGATGIEPASPHMVELGTEPQQVNFTVTFLSGQPNPINLGIEIASAEDCSNPPPPPPPGGGLICITSGYAFFAGEHVTAVWADSGESFDGWILITPKGEMLIHAKPGERNQGTLLVTNGVATVAVNITVDGCDIPGGGDGTTTPTETPTPVPYSSDRAAIRFSVDCDQNINLVTGSYQDLWYEWQSLDGVWHFWQERYELPTEAVALRVWMKGGTELFNVPIDLDFSDCPVQQTAEGPTIWIGTGMGEDPGVVLWPNGKTVSSMWFEQDGRPRQYLETWTVPSMSQCDGQVLSQFVWQPNVNATVVVYFTDGSVLREPVPTGYTGADVNCSNIRRTGEGFWEIFIYPGNTYPELARFLGFNFSNDAQKNYEEFVKLVESLRGDDHASSFIIPDNQLYLFENLTQG